VLPIAKIYQKRSYRLSLSRGLINILTAACAVPTLSLDMIETTGQPQEKTFRTVIRSSRFTPEEWATIEEYAAAVGLSPSRYMRQASLRTPFSRRLNHEVIVALNRIGVNLNNMIRLAIRSGQAFIAADAADVLARLRERLESLL